MPSPQEHDPLMPSPDAALLADLLGAPPALGLLLLGQFGSLAALGSAPVEALARVPGMGRARARRLHAAWALCQRSRPSPPPRITTARQAYEALRPLLEDQDIEQLVGLYLGARGQLLARRVLSLGTPTHTVMQPVHVLRPAVQLGASLLVLGHNHPSGDPEPSVQDVEATGRLADAAAVLGLRLLDHIVVGAGCWCSIGRLGALAPWSLPVPPSRR